MEKKFGLGYRGVRVGGVANRGVAIYRHRIAHPHTSPLFADITIAIYPHHHSHILVIFGDIS